MTELDELKRRIETCHATIREQRAEIERLHACAEELLSDLQRIDETSCLSDGDSVSVCVALWAGDWAKRMKDAGFVTANKEAFPPVLDACCGSRMFWFDQHDERALYVDNRQGTRIIDVGTPGTVGRTPKTVAPDMLADFRNLPFPANTFLHVVFDPPHFNKGAGATGRIAWDFGLLADTWRDDKRQGFAECFRVLRPGGTLVFKWCEAEIPLREVLALTPEKPLYGHRSGKKAQTHWIAFLKPNEKVETPK